MSERWELLKPLVTAKVKTLAHQRILTGQALVSPKGEPCAKRADVKIALLVVQILNPFEMLQKEEEALLRGVSADTLLRRGNEIKKL